MLETPGDPVAQRHIESRGLIAAFGALRCGVNSAVKDHVTDVVGEFLCVDLSDKRAIRIAEVVEFFVAQHGAHHIEVFSNTQRVKVREQRAGVFHASVYELLRGCLFGSEPLVASPNARRDVIQEGIEFLRVGCARDRRRLAYPSRVKADDVVSVRNVGVDGFAHTITNECDSTLAGTARIHKERAQAFAIGRGVSNERQCG